MHIIGFIKGKEITPRNINLSHCVLQFEMDCALWLIMYFSYNHHESTKKVTNYCSDKAFIRPLELM